MYALLGGNVSQLNKNSLYHKLSSQDGSLII